MISSSKIPLGLYIHIPFCKQKCIYCDFYSLPNSEKQEQYIDDYVNTLSRQLTALSISGQFSGYQVDTIYFGGGTPSYLGPERLIKLLKTIQNICEVSEHAEITLEANPDSTRNPDHLRLLHCAGFNRISLGMQSASSAELELIGRIHTPQQTIQSVSAARQAGFQNLSLDLIYGLPGQSLVSWQKNLIAAVQLGPEHLSCYGLKVEPGTPLAALVQSGNIVNLPDDSLQADMYLWAVHYLEQQGYLQYEISNFARPGYLSRHNWKYWTLGEYAGFGPGAHSDWHGIRSAWPRDFKAYLQDHSQDDSENNALSYSEFNIMSPIERAKEYWMLGLRTIRGINPQEYERKFRRSSSPALAFLEQCRQAGYAIWETKSKRWHLTPTGFLLSNSIILEVLDRLF